MTPAQQRAVAAGLTRDEDGDWKYPGPGWAVVWFPEARVAEWWRDGELIAAPDVDAALTAYLDHIGAPAAPVEAAPCLSAEEIAAAYRAPSRGSGIPDGYREVARGVYEGHGRRVYTGEVDEDDEVHHCDAMGCRWEHILRVETMDPPAAPVERLPPPAPLPTLAPAAPVEAAPWKAYPHWTDHFVDCVPYALRRMDELKAEVAAATDRADRAEADLAALRANPDPLAYLAADAAAWRNAQEKT